MLLALCAAAVACAQLSPQELRDRTMLVASAAYEKDHATLSEWACAPCNATAMVRPRSERGRARRR